MQLLDCHEQGEWGVSCCQDLGRTAPLCMHVNGTGASDGCFNPCAVAAPAIAAESKSSLASVEFQLNLSKLSHPLGNPLIFCCLKI